MNPYLKWALLAFVDYFNAVAGRVLAPLVVLFATEDDHLPRWLSWFDTPDNPLSGDSGWVTEHWQFRYKLSPKLGDYVGRVGWLWRNNMYGFDINVLGAKVESTDRMELSGDLLTSDRPAHSGSVTRKLFRNGRLIYFQWYFVLTYGKTRCVRINLGWKLWGFYNTNNNLQYTAYVNPFKGAYR